MRDNFNRKTKGYVFLLLAMIFFLNLSSFPARAEPVETEDEKLDFFELRDLDEKPEGFFSMKDKDTKEVIMRTARVMHVGDEYISQKNYFYRVESIDEEIAWAHNLGKIKLSDFAAEKVSRQRSARPGAFQEAARETPPEFTIGIYHSHGAESYVPSDGTESVLEGGGILEVGKVFAQALEEKGFHVYYSPKTHVPHDAGAYHRSRRTAEELLHSNADALFDVHRDAVPPEDYLETVNGDQKVQIQFVVGRQNPIAEVNREYAESLKQFTDEQYPGLIKGIFMANGNYNQDLTPLSLLLEVGAHENSKYGAEDSMKLFANTVHFYYMGPEGSAARGGGWRAPPCGWFYGWFSLQRWQLASIFCSARAAGRRPAPSWFISSKKNLPNLEK
jgi:stage II sporulation protein P